MYNYEQAYPSPTTSQPVFTPHAAQVAAAGCCSAPSSNGGQIPVMTWNPPASMDKHRQHPTFNNYMNAPRANSVQGMPLPDLPMIPPPPPPPQRHISDQVSTHQPKLTTSYWEDEGTICYQVDARGICVARRQDNDMVNGTKLLNVVGMSRGKRDGILKNERGRVVVKVGAMHLKGVWITFSRAKALAAQYNITDVLQPLFADDPSVYFYMNAPPPPPPLMAPLGGYYMPMGYPPQYAVRNNNNNNSSNSSNVASAPEIPSMVPQDMYPYPSQDQQQYVRRERPSSTASHQFRPPSASFHDPIYSFEMEKIGSNHSLVDYASKAGGSSSVLSGISDSAPATPGSQQHYHSQLLIHPYDNNNSSSNAAINATGTGYVEPTTGTYGDQMDMYIAQYYQQQPSPHHGKWIDPPGMLQHPPPPQQRTSW